MPDPKDFLPQPPWEGPPFPRLFSSEESRRGGIIRALRAEVLEEIRWKSTKEGRRELKYEGESGWAREEWGEVKNGMVTLFHGTHPSNVAEILEKGLRAMLISEIWDLGESEEDEEEYDIREGLFLAVTPYYAFSFGDVCVRVRIPVEWITEVEEGVQVDRDIPPEMIMEVKSVGDWRANR